MENKKVPTYIIDGGIGKHTMFTSIIPELAKKSPLGRINICSAYTNAFEYIDTKYICVLFGLDVMFGPEFKQYTSEVIHYEPYRSNFGLDGDGHLMKYWCKGLGVDYDPNTLPLEINVTNSEILEKVQDIVTEHPNFILVQFTGGQSAIGFTPEMQYQNNMMQFQRNYQYMFANLLVSKIKKVYPDLTIIDYSLPNEHPGYTDAIRVDLPTIGYAELVKYAKTVIGIDSSLLHFAAAQRKPGIGLWGGCPSWQFGWNIHKNLTNFNGDPKDFNPMDPYYISIDSEIIMSELKGLLNASKTR